MTLSCGGGEGQLASLTSIKNDLLLGVRLFGVAACASVASEPRGRGQQRCAWKGHKSHEQLTKGHTKAGESRT